MAEYTLKDGLPSKGPGDVGSRNCGKRKRQAPSIRQPNDRPTSADYTAPSQRTSQRPQNARNRHNLASQIRSLEKLLKHPGAKMTANVRQEKGRELAALVLERERKRAKSRATKNLGKYHMVRFIERQKCERILKGLKKQLLQIQESRRLATRKAKAKAGARAKASSEDSDTDMDEDGGAVLPDSKEVVAEAKIKQAEVDLNYTIYAPLGEKYISLFPPTGKEKISGMSGLSKSFLEPEEEAEVRRLKDDNIVRNATGVRPPMWFRVQESMQDRTLEQLRDGKLTAGPITIPQVGGKSRTMQRTKSTPDWLRDEGAIPAEDLDDDDESDDDEQKKDGGFFEQK
jgi:hypothetical protein